VCHGPPLTLVHVDNGTSTTLLHPRSLYPGQPLRCSTPHDSNVSCHVPMPCTEESTKTLWPRLWHEAERQQDVTGRQVIGSSTTRQVWKAWWGHDGHIVVVEVMMHGQPTPQATMGGMVTRCSLL
jgi:hypothetical protein